MADLVKYQQNKIRELSSKPPQSKSKNIIEYLSKPQVSSLPNGLIEVAKQLVIICEFYSIKQPSKETLQILALDILNEYPDFRLTDYVRAFKMAAKNRLPGANINPYGAELNLRLLHDLFSRYRLKRNKIIRKDRESFEAQKRNVGQCDEETKKKINENYEKYKNQLSKKLK